MSFDRDFVPETRIPESEIEEEHREIVAESGTIADVIEGLRVGGYSITEAGSLIKQEIDRLKERAEERVRERYEDQCSEEGCCA